MDILKLVLLVLIGGLIGYSTNKLAIKMLFRPVNPVKILFFTVQGVFPKRKDSMAIGLADTIEKELLSKDVIIDKIFNEEKIEGMKEMIKDTLIKEVSGKIPPMVRMFMGENPEGMIAKLLDKEGDKIMNNIISEMKQKGLEDLNIHDIVKERIDALDFVEFEKIIFGLMSQELRFVEIIGLFLGAFIGLIQYFVVYFIG